MLGVSRTIYVNVDSPNLGFPYFNFLGEAQWKKDTLYKIVFNFSPNHGVGGPLGYSFPLG